MEKAAILEQEIAELSRAIEEKRSALEASREALPEREIVHQVVSNYVGPTVSSVSQVSNDDDSNNSYLDTLDSVSVAKVNQLVSSIGEHGFKRAIAEAKKESAYVLDAFHDALVGHLYEELKSRGVVK